MFSSVGAEFLSLRLGEQPPAQPPAPAQQQMTPQSPVYLPVSLRRSEQEPVSAQPAPVSLLPPPRRRFELFGIAIENRCRNPFPGAKRGHGRSTPLRTRYYSDRSRTHRPGKPQRTLRNHET